MCYSAEIEADYRLYSKLYGAHISIKEFVALYWARAQGTKLKLPKGMDVPFADAAAGEALDARQAIEQFASDQARRLEEELFVQRKRLAEAERALLVKPTKAAASSQRIATDKISKAMARLVDLRRTDPRGRDARIFPMVYAPVMVMENGQRVVKPMRYQCRPAGKPAFYDTKYPGTYNARLDNLEGFWKGQFGHTHGLMIVRRFYENVNRHRAEGRELREGEDVQNVVLEFNPQPARDMLVACLWSRWSAPGEPDLLSFAAITDEPPAEVAAAGHDRCIVPIKPANIDAWLNPDPTNLAAQYAILGDRDPMYYDHRLAA